MKFKFNLLDALECPKCGNRLGRNMRVKDYPDGPVMSMFMEHEMGCSSCKTYVETQSICDYDEIVVAHDLMQKLKLLK